MGDREQLLFEIPILNNIADCLQKVSCELDCLEDFLSQEEGFCIASCVKDAAMHLSMGVELLLKFRLLNEHWAFIFDDVNKATEASLESGDFVSVGFQRGIDRLENLCGIDVTAYFSASRELYRYRNKAMHFTLSGDADHLVHTLLRSLKEMTAFVQNEIIIHIENEDALEDFRSELRDISRYSDRLMLQEKKIVSLCCRDSEDE